MLEKYGTKKVQFLRKDRVDVWHFLCTLCGIGKKNKSDTLGTVTKLQRNKRLPIRGAASQK